MQLLQCIAFKKGAAISRVFFPARLNSSFGGKFKFKEMQRINLLKDTAIFRIFPSFFFRI